MTEEENKELSKLVQRVCEINFEMAELRRINPTIYPENLINELTILSDKISTISQKKQ